MNKFREQIDFITNKYQLTTLGQALDRMEDRTKIALTFDDGYLSIYTNVFPILEKHNIKATVFVVGDNARANRNELGNSQSLLNFTQIKNLYSEGWEIGFHTSTHTNLLILNEKELRKEIIEGKKELENKLGFKIRYFAYPKGKYNDKVLGLVKEAGFKAAFTVDGGILRLDNPLLITRTLIDGSVDLEQFKTMISPLGLRSEDLYVRILKLKDYILSKGHLLFN
jgi:peptidoglycan/xylan/chitin deacetylase (PgdA/CDA1 family)